MIEPRRLAPGRHPKPILVVVGGVIMTDSTTGMDLSHLPPAIRMIAQADDATRLHA